MSTGGRKALIAAVRRELAEARGAARTVLAAAEEARGQSQQRRQRIRDAYATCLHRLAEARDAARLDIEHRYRYESVRLAGTVRHLAAQSATGAAGLPWRMWTPTEPADGRGPGLLRIGTLALDDTTALPGLVPLLDTAHLQFDGPPGEVDQVITGLLLRALGSTRPGDVRVTVYDPGSGDTFAPFTPLGVSFVGAGGLDSLLDALAEHIDRITATVLAGEHPSLAEPALATTGPRPEPWRIVVLLADASTMAELTRARLDRVVRAGVACGIHLVVRGLDLPGHPAVHRLAVRDRTATGAVTGDLAVRLDPPPAADQVASFCRAAAERMPTAALK